MDRNLHFAGLASAKRGLVTTEELLRGGLSTASITRWSRSGRLHRMFHGVHLLGHAVPPPLARELAALLACGPTAVLSHWTAAALHLILVPGPRTIHVTVPGRRCRQQPGLQPHAGALEVGDVTTFEGLRITTARRTLQDLKPFLDGNAYDRARHEAQTLRLIPLDPGERGVTRREAERRLRKLLERAGLARRARFNAPLGRYTVDVVFPAEKLILEFDSWTFHRTRRAFENDRVRDAEHAARGYRTLRITWWQLTEHPEALVARVAAALAVVTSAAG